MSSATVKGFCCRAKEQTEKLAKRCGKEMRRPFPPWEAPRARGQWPRAFGKNIKQTNKKLGATVADCKSKQFPNTPTFANRRKGAGFFVKVLRVRHTSPPFYTASLCELSRAYTSLADQDRLASLAWGSCCFCLGGSCLAPTPLTV